MGRPRRHPRRASLARRHATSGWRRFATTLPRRRRGRAIHPTTTHASPNSSPPDPTPSPTTRRLCPSHRAQPPMGHACQCVPIFCPRPRATHQRVWPRPPPFLPGPNHFLPTMRGHEIAFRGAVPPPPMPSLGPRRHQVPYPHIPSRQGAEQVLPRHPRRRHLARQTPPHQSQNLTVCCHPRPPDRPRLTEATSPHAAHSIHHRPVRSRLPPSRLR